MRDTHSVQQKLEYRSFLLMLLLVSILFLFLLKPFFAPIFWACVIGLIFYPVYQAVMRRWGHRPNLAAVATLALCVVIVVIPILFIFSSFFQEGTLFYQRLKSGDLDFNHRIEQIQNAFPVIEQFLQRFNIDLNGLTSKISGAALVVSQHVAQNAVQLGQGTAQFFVNIGLMLYIAFFHAT